MCCRKESGKPKKHEKPSGYWGTAASCDIPLRTAEQFAMFAAKEVQPDGIIWTGDNPSHDFWAQTIPTQMNATQTIADLLVNNFDLNKTSIFPTFGNHDAYPANMFDPTTNSTQWLKDHMSNITTNLFKTPEIGAQIKKNGYYSYLDPRLEIRFLGLNTDFGNVMNLFNLGDPTDPQNHLAWLRQELKDSEQAGERVIIVGHIPPGVGFMSSSIAMWSVS